MARWRPLAPQYGTGLQLTPNGTVSRARRVRGASLLQVLRYKVSGMGWRMLILRDTGAHNLADVRGGANRRLRRVAGGKTRGLYESVSCFS